MHFMVFINSPGHASYYIYNQNVRRIYIIVLGVYLRHDARIGKKKKKFGMF